MSKSKDQQRKAKKLRSSAKKRARPFVPLFKILKKKRSAIFKKFEEAILTIDWEKLLNKGEIDYLKQLKEYGAIIYGSDETKLRKIGLSIQYKLGDYLFSSVEFNKFNCQLVGYDGCMLVFRYYEFDVVKSAGYRYYAPSNGFKIAGKALCFSEHAIDRELMRCALDNQEPFTKYYCEREFTMRDHGSMKKLTLRSDIYFDAILNIIIKGKGGYDVITYKGQDFLRVYDERFIDVNWSSELRTIVQGYCPIIYTDELIIAKTKLLPTMHGTPEYDHIKDNHPELLETIEDISCFEDLYGDYACPEVLEALKCFEIVGRREMEYDY